MTMDNAFLQARIDAVKLRIVVYEDAITALVTGGVQQYTLDTGQTRQTVTKLDIDNLQKALDSMMNQLATWQARLNGSGVIHVRPGY